MESKNTDSQLQTGKLPREVLMWPACFAIAPFLLLIALLAIPNARILVLFLGLPVIAIPTLIAVTVSCFSTAASLKEQRYLRAFSALILPVVCVVAVMEFRITLVSCATAASYVQFFVGYPFFAHAVSQLPRINGPRLAVFTMDGFISMSNGVAFDESDELGLPVGQQTNAWRAHAGHTALGDDDWVSKRLIGHYYLWWSG